MKGDRDDGIDRRERVQRSIEEVGQDNDQVDLSMVFASADRIGQGALIQSGGHGSRECRRGVAARATAVRRTVRQRRRGLEWNATDRTPRAIQPGDGAPTRRADCTRLARGQSTAAHAAPAWQNRIERGSNEGPHPEAVCNTMSKGCQRAPDTDPRTVARGMKAAFCLLNSQKGQVPTACGRRGP